jgi:hypothetical protein
LKFRIELNQPSGQFHTQSFESGAEKHYQDILKGSMHISVISQNKSQTRPKKINPV